MQYLPLVEEMPMANNAFVLLEKQFKPYYMQNLNRDLLVITKKNMINQQELEQTIISLNNVLFETENIGVICNATEVFDLNTYRLYTSAKKVSYYINKANSKPFVFLSNKN